MTIRSSVVGLLSHNHKIPMPSLKTTLKLLLICSCCAYGFTNCKKPGITRVMESYLQKEIERHETSMNEYTLNTWIANTQIVAVTDLHTNRTAIIKNGRYMDSWNALTGIKDNHISRTALGVFSIHAIHYCPKHVLSNGTTKAPCSDDNLLGTYAAWYKNGWMYGIHGRPEVASIQQNFEKPAQNRYQTRGCVAAPADKLEEFIQLILSHEAMRPHAEAIQKIRTFRSQNIHQEVYIDIEKTEGIDAKLLVIDTRGWSDRGLALEPNTGPNLRPVASQSQSTSLPSALNSPEDLLSLFGSTNTEGYLRASHSQTPSQKVSFLNLLASNKEKRQHFELSNSCQASTPAKNNASCYYFWTRVNKNNQL